MECFFVRKWYITIWSWLVCSRRFFAICLRSCHLGIYLFCFLCCTLSKFSSPLDFFVFYQIFPDFSPQFSFFKLFLKHEITRLPFQFFLLKLNFWALVRPKYLPFLKRSETGVQNISLESFWLGDEKKV